MSTKDMLNSDNVFGKWFCLQEYYPEDRETIYRYMHFWKFIHIVFQRKLHLSRGDQFEDSLEGNETELSRNIRAAVHDNPTFESNTSYYDRNLRCVAISCWYTGDAESREMWDSYAPGPYGILVRSTVGRLRNALSQHEEKLCIQEIKYVDNHSNEFTKFGCPFYPFSIKDRRRFGHESEVRVMFGDGKRCQTESPLYKASELNKSGVELETDPLLLIDAVILSPRAPVWFLKFISDIIAYMNMELNIEASAFST